MTTVPPDVAAVSHRLLVTVTGQDRPGVAATLFSSLGDVEAVITDIGQITIRGHLVLCVELDCAETDGEVSVTNRRRPNCPTGI